MLSIALGATEALKDITTRIQELAEQAANGTISHVQRDALNAEAQELIQEYERVIQTTGFNGRTLITRNADARIGLQAGFGTAGVVNVDMAVVTERYVPSLVYAATAASPAGAGISELYLADFRNVGELDAIVMANSYDGLKYFRTYNDGTFQGYDQYINGAPGNNGLTLGDFNNDGNLEFAHHESDGGFVRVLTGDGFGGFTTTYSHTTGQYGRDLKAGDVNDDGNLDLISFFSGGFDVYLGNGDGTMTYDGAVATPMNGLGVGGVADFDHNGFEDVVAYNDINNRFDIYLSDGTGGFNLSSSVVSPDTGQILMADINADGNVDILQTRINQASIAVVLGNGDGSFQGAQYYGVGVSPDGIAVGDLDDDGTLDVAVANTGDGSVSILRGNADGTFQTQVQTQSYGMSVRGVAIGDINNDGIADLVVTDNGSGNMLSLIGGSELQLDVIRAPSLVGVNLSTLSGARDAMPLLRSALQDLNLLSAALGTSMSRLDVVLNVVRTARENTTDATARIMDADIAQESADAVKTRIRLEGAAALLGVANDRESQVLNLIQSGLSG